MKQIFTDFEIYLGERGYIGKEDWEKIFDILEAGIITTDDTIECKSAGKESGFRCSVESKGYINFPMKNKKVEAIDVIDLGGLKVSPSGDISISFKEDSVCGVIIPEKGRLMEGKDVLICKKIGGI